MKAKEEYMGTRKPSDRREWYSDAQEGAKHLLWILQNGGYYANETALKAVVRILKVAGHLIRASEREGFKADGDIYHAESAPLWIRLVEAYVWTLNLRKMAGGESEEPQQITVTASFPIEHAEAVFRKIAQEPQGELLTLLCDNSPLREGETLLVTFEKIKEVEAWKDA